jgi:hypothetical protein
MNISVNIVAPMPRMEPVTPEQGYMASVEAFLPSFELLAVSGDRHARASALVGGLIVECLLKAYLVHTKSKPDKPGDVLQGHDLQSLWSDAEQAGLPIPAVVPAWCVVLNCLHFGNKDPENKGENRRVPRERTFPLRYQSTMHVLRFPVSREMLEGVLALSSAVANAICS